jgi:hypothetical protein
MVAADTVGCNARIGCCTATGAGTAVVVVVAVALETLAMKTPIW